MTGKKKYRVKKKLAGKKKKKRRVRYSPRENQTRKIDKSRVINPSIRTTPPKEKKKITRKQTRKEIAANAERKQKYKTHQYKERAKRLRPFFKDNFEAKEGFDLRRPDSWTPAQKAKVTKYFRVMAPHITGDYVTKRYRNKENEQAAFDASLQEHRLKGQTGIAFRRTDPREKLEIIVRKGKATIKQSGVKKVKLKFDRKAFLENSDKEIDRVLKETNANTFRIIAGGSMQLKTLTRKDIKAEMAALMKNYAPGKVKKDQGQRAYTDWLNGVVAYEGTDKQTFTQVEKFIHRQEQQSAKNEIARLDQLSKDRGGKGYSRTISDQVEMRKKRKGQI